MNRTRDLLIIIAIFSVAGCAGGISRQTKLQIDYSGTFSELQRNPDAQRGRVALLGGRILDTRVSRNRSELTVLQLPLVGGDRPASEEESRGRFIVESDDFLDPEIYRKGTLITVAGRVTEGSFRRIGGYDYLYPVVRPIEIRFWTEADRGYPRFHFGIGVGKVF